VSVSEYLAGIARLAAAAGDAARAARLFGAALAVRAPTGAVRYAPDQATYERDIAAVRARLGEIAFAAAQG
jgi:hypothetical protein